MVIRPHHPRGLTVEALPKLQTTYPMTLQVALITGGASGIGLAVATILSTRPDWEVHILDICQAGQQAVQKLTGTIFHQADVTKYAELSGAFEETFRAHNRLDFVFANAGMIERDNFYAQQSKVMGEAISSPPEPDLSSIEVNLTAVMCTTKLAHYYFLRSSAQERGANLVMTSSCGGLYPSFYSPIYSAAKAGMLAFMRSVAPTYKNDGVRVNAICPGIVRTNLLDQAEWVNFPENQFLSIDLVANVVLQLVNGGQPAGQGITDSWGAHRPELELFGCAVEISTSGVYFRDPPGFCDQGMCDVMGATALKNQLGPIFKEV